MATRREPLTLDPAAYGDFTMGPSRPARIRDRCPDCGRAIEWVDEYVDTGVGTESRWTGAFAECPCGLQLNWCPDRTDRIEARRAAAIEEYNTERATGQMRIL